MSAFFRPSGRTVFLLIALIMIVMAGLSTMSAALPTMRPAIFEEDRLVEWLTAAAFLAAGLTALVRFLRSRRDDLLLLIVAISGVFGFLDELSFGERIFGLQLPRILGTKLDSVHDLILIGKKVIERITPSPYLFSAFLALLLAAALYGAARLAIARGWRMRGGPEVALLIAVPCLLAVAQAIDVNLRVVPHQMLKPLYIEEILELGAGMALLAFAVLRRPGAPEITPAPARPV